MGIKFPVNHRYFRTWSPRMAYVLGFIFADGSLEYADRIRGKYVRISNTDKDRISLIRRLLHSSHRIYEERRGPTRKVRYLLRIGDGILYDSLVALGVTPAKSLTMRFPVIPDRNLRDFVRGYFDGDGCVQSERRNGAICRIRVVFTSGSKQFLSHLHIALKERTRVGGRGLYPHASTKGAYQLRYSTRDSIRIHLYMYYKGLPVEMSLARKYDIFTEYLKLRGITSRNVARVLEQRGPMAK